MNGKLRPRLTLGFRTLVSVVTISAGFGLLIQIPACWLNWETQTAQEQARLATNAKLLAIQSSVREPVERFDRIAARIRGQELAGDSVALNERLLRTEPLIAPAVGLTIISGRGSQIASSISPTQANSLLSGLRDQAPLPPGKPTLLGCTPGLGSPPGWLLAKSLEASQDKGGIIATTLSNAAIRSLVSVEQDGKHQSVVLQTSPGCEILRYEPPPIAWQPSSWLLRFLLHYFWHQRDAEISFTAKGSIANITILVSETEADALALRGPMLERRVGSVMAGAGSLAGLLVLLGIAAMVRNGQLEHASRLDCLASAGTEDRALADCEKARRERDEVVVDCDRVLAAVGHDIRTPMNSILGICELLMEGDLTADQRKWQQRIRASCEALLAMTNGMLETATTRAGRTAIHLEEVDVAGLVEEVSGVLRDQAEDKGLELILSLDETVLGFWRTDPTRLRQVLYNLGGNAIKYTAQGSIRIGAAITYGGDGSARLHLQVTDTGLGITSDERERIFERYQRGREEVSLGQEGVGLGLTLCRDIASLLEGLLSFESTPGIGSTFTLEVPIERATRAIPVGGPLAGRSVLVVGFTEGMRHQVAGQLERLGMVVETTGDGFLAAGHAERMSLKHSKLDLVVLDGALRGLAADAVLVRLQGIRSVAKDMRSVVVANGNLPSSIEGRVDAVLPHPVEARRMEEIVGGLFGDGSILKEVYPGAPLTPSLRVLVVEDSRISQALVVERLTRAGFSAFVASNGREAVEAVLRGGFDVVLMDVQMPEIDGLEAAKQIRVAENGERRLPIVGMTAHTGADIRSKCIVAGMDVVLHKPIEFAALPLRLRQVIAVQRVRTGNETAELDAADAGNVSREHLQELVAEFGAERAAAFVSAFLGETEPNMAHLRSAFKNSRWKELGDLAHRMSGVSSSLGALEFSDSLLAVEAAARGFDAERAGEAINGAEGVWAHTRVSVTAQFAQLCPKWTQTFVSDGFHTKKSGTR